jgi:hypothetical protein
VGKNMKLPIWIYDYKKRKYVVFPFHLLTTFPDGKVGIVTQTATMDQYKILNDFAHLFELDDIWCLSPRQSHQVLQFVQGRYVLKERQSKPKSKDEHQIKRHRRPK